MTPTGQIDCILCRCHGEIDGVVDVQRLKRQLENDFRVHSVSICDALCLDGHVAALAERMGHERGQNVLIAACSPFARGDELVARLGKQGIDPGRLLVTDIREGCAWIHAAHPAAATGKAMDIVRTGVARLHHRECSADPDISVTPRVMVIGAGPAGMSAAIALGRAGVDVDLVEGRRELGGMLNRLSTVAPNDRSAQDVQSPLVETVEATPRIRVHLGARATRITGNAGNFNVSVVRNNDHGRLTVGAVIVATGAKPVLPHGFYRYGRIRGVISALELEKAFKDGSPVAGPTVFIQCVAARDEKRPYCSAVCCPAALKNAIRMKAIDPGAAVTVVHRDIMSPGNALEKEYRRALAAGVRFVRFSSDHPPRIDGDGRVAGVRVTDILAGKERYLDADRVVLSTPLDPRVQPDGKHPLISPPGLLAGPHGFYRVQPFLHTLETPLTGVFVCGAARWPVMVDGAMAQGKAAAAKALSLVSHPVQKASRLIGFQAARAACARVSRTTCTGCGSCVAVCPYSACSLEKTDAGLRATVDPVRCMGCGSCAAACPNGSMSLPEIGERTMVRMIASAFGAGSPAVVQRQTAVADGSAHGCRKWKKGSTSTP